LGPVKLGWESQGGRAAILVTGQDCDPERLIAELLDHMRGRHTWPTFSGKAPDGTAVGDEAWDDVKVPLEAFAELLCATRPHAGKDRLPADFLTALGSDLVTAQNSDLLKPSALHMTSGNQKFLETLRELAASLDDTEPAHRKASCPPADAFREGLFGEWTYRDEFSSLGYDPATEAIYALTAAAPTDTGPRSTRAPVWLAVEAIPLYPCFPKARRLHTRGFDRRVSRFRWPIWECPLSLDAIRTLLGLAAVYGTGADFSPRSLREYGIAAVFECDRVTIGKGYGQFRSAAMIC
jgi:hypothetical protein